MELRDKWALHYRIWTRLHLLGMWRRSQQTESSRRYPSEETDGLWPLWRLRCKFWGNYRIYEIRKHFEHFTSNFHWCYDWDLFLIHYDTHFRVSQYEQRIQGLTHVHQSIKDDLTEFEKLMVHNHDLIEIRGKVSITSSFLLKENMCRLII